MTGAPCQPFFRQLLLLSLDLLVTSASPQDCDQHAGALASRVPSLGTEDRPGPGKAGPRGLPAVPTPAPRGRPYFSAPRRHHLSQVVSSSLSVTISGPDVGDRVDEGAELGPGSLAGGQESKRD